MKIYLAGQISENPETIKWRKRINFVCDDIDELDIIDPCNNSFSKEGRKDKILFKKIKPLITPRDYSYVLSSDGVIANLNWYTKEIPMIGTFFELAIYKLCPEKVVVGIFDGDPSTDIVCQHPFVNSTIHTWVKNEDEALDIFLKFFC